MFIIIPYGSNYTSTVSQLFPAKCKCEKCGYEFDCELFVTGKGQSNSFMWLRNEAARQEATAYAYEDLKRNLNNPIVFPRPCPSCGWYQTPMVRYHLSTIFPNLGLFSFCLLPIILLILFMLAFFLSNSDGWAVAVTSILSSPATWIVLGIPIVTIIIIYLLHHFSNLNRPFVLIKRIKRPYGYRKSILDVPN